MDNSVRIFSYTLIIAKLRHPHRAAQNGVQGDFAPAGATKGLSDRPLETFGYCIFKYAVTKPLMLPFMTSSMLPDSKEVR